MGETIEYAVKMHGVTKTFGKVIANPYEEQVYFVVGLTL